MSGLQQAAELCNRVLTESDATNTPVAESVTVQRGRVGSEFIEAAERLGTLLADWNCSAGWQQYQSGVVRPECCSETVVVDHPDHGRLLDAELCAADGRSLTIRHIGEGWQVAWWQPGEGEEWLCDRLDFRALGGGRLEYLRIWQPDQRGVLQPVSAWLMDVSAASGKESRQ